MRRFAAGLEKNLATVEAGLTLRWTNGLVEGLVNKLKLVKTSRKRYASWDI